MITDRHSGNQWHAQYFHTQKNMDVIEPKYNKAREIASATVCPNPDSNIDSPHWKCLFHCCQQFTQLYLTR